MRLADSSPGGPLPKVPGSHPAPEQERGLAVEVPRIFEGRSVLSYPVRLIPTPKKTVKVMFLDVPEAVAEGDNEQDALDRAKYALELALGHRLIGQREIPPPSDICGAPTVTTAKFILQPAPEDRKAPLSGGRY